MVRISALFLALLLLVPPLAVAQPEAVETELDGVTASVLELRAAGGVVRLAVRFTNASGQAADPTRYTAERITLVDVKSKKKYFPLKDATGRYVAGPIGDWIDGGRIQLLVPARQATVVWAYFEPLAVGTVMNIEMPYVFPFEGVAVSDQPGVVTTSSTAKSTPHGALMTLVSAARANEVVTIRMRLRAEPGAKPSLGGSYFEYANVFLFDPAGKRKYPMVKDTEGMFQGQPLSVRMDGGSFIPDWSKTTLISLTFQAPPDSVTTVDLLLPRFLPLEAIRITGLGGAATGGVAAAGKELGLEGALKELRAEVTPAEIRIDLAADVLFEFDQAVVKRDAEPSLHHLATVLNANPTAAVTIEGHTDGRGADAYNQTLSEQRAAAVKQWLVTNAQVSAARVATRGWGKTRPAAPNTNPDGSDSAEGRAKNRRVQVVVRKP